TLSLHDALPIFKRVIQVIQKKRFDHLHDIGYGGIVHSQATSVFRTDHRLDHGTKDVRINCRPIQFTAVDYSLTRTSSEKRRIQWYLEQSPIHIREFIQIGRSFVALFLGCIQYVKQGIQIGVQIASIGLGMRSDPIGELSLLKDSGILGKKAE